MVPIPIQGRNLPQRVRGVVHDEAHYGVIHRVPYTGHQEQVAHEEGCQTDGVGEVDGQIGADHGVAQVLAQAAHTEGQLPSHCLFHVV